MSEQNMDMLNKKVLMLYQQGFSCKDISRICNVSLLHIRKYLKSVGIETRTYRKVSDCNKNKVLLLIRAGYSYSQIEQLLHVSTHLIREIVADNGLIGFAPKNHAPVELNVEPSEICSNRLNDLRVAYLSGLYGLAKCAAVTEATDEIFLWFVFHLTDKEKKTHERQLKSNIAAWSKDSMPVTAIAKAMDISPSIVKKILLRAV